MKAAAILLMSIGLLSLLKDAQATFTLSMKQQHQMETVFHSIKCVIARATLIKILVGYGMLEKTANTIVPNLDPNNNGIEAGELFPNQDVIDRITKNYPGGVAPFFQFKRDGVSPRELRDILKHTQFGDESKVNVAIEKIDGDRDGAIGWVEFTADQAVVDHLLKNFFKA